jgi:hypothetical protein
MDVILNIDHPNDEYQVFQYVFVVSENIKLVFYFKNLNTIYLNRRKILHEKRWKNPIKHLKINQ